MRTRIVPAYSQLARCYDVALGRASFAHLRRLFETLALRYGLRFRSAADVGCGTGLFARYLAESRGVPVFAVDSAAAMVSVARRRCAGARVRVLAQDLRALALPRPVDLVTANFDVVNHLTNLHDLAQAFRRIAVNLAPGGHFVFDAITDCDPLGGRSTYVRQLPGGIVQEIRWDPLTRTLQGSALFRQGHARAERHVERAHSLLEVGHALRDAGFAIRGVHDAATGAAARTCPPRVAIVAREAGRRTADRGEVRNVPES